MGWMWLSLGLVGCVSYFQQEQSNCRIISGPWEIPAQIQSMKMAYDFDGPALVYEGMVGRTPRTVWHPFKKDWQLASEGVSLGKDRTWTAKDFQMHSEANRALWATYRARKNEGYLERGFVEYVDAKTKLRKIFELPTPRENSVGQLWLVPLGKGVFVITRSPYDSKASDEASFSEYRLFFLEGNAQPKLHGQVLLNDADFSASNFFIHAGMIRPFALGTRQKQRAQEIEYHVLLKNIFEKQSSDTFLYQSKTPLASVIGWQDSKTQELSMAWIQEPEEDLITYIVWSSVQELRAGKSPIRMPLNHFPGALALKPYQGRPILQWRATIENAEAMILFDIHNQKMLRIVPPYRYPKILNGFTHHADPHALHLLSQSSTNHERHSKVTLCRFDLKTVWN